MRTKYSTELIVILAVLLALVLIVVNQIQNKESIAQNQSETFSQALVIINQASSIGKIAVGASCLSNSGCQSGVCESTGSVNEQVACKKES